MPAYMILQIHVTDPDGIAAYRDAIGPLMTTFGGRSIVRGAEIDVLEGRPGDRPFSIIEFPSMEALRGFWDSPEYQEAKKLRTGAADMDIWAVPGV